MSSARLLAKLAAYPVRPGWFTVVIKELAKDLSDLLQSGSAVQSGMNTIAEGTTVTNLLLDTTTTVAVLCKLNGVLKASLAIINDVSLVAAGGVMAQPVYADGSDATGIDLVGASGDIAQVTLIVADTDNAGGATGDGGAALYVAVVAGTAATWQSAAQPLTDAEIEAALAASAGVHDGTTGWARLADIVWDEGGSAPVATYIINRDA
jgi:hypothetical protein